MIIAISMNVVQSSAYRECRDALSHDWIRFLDGLGVTALLVPNLLDDPVEYCRRVGVSGILLTSGNDVAPGPGEDWAASASIAPERDETEARLICHAAEERIPLFGVCRGMQIVNAYFGGSLERDLVAWTGGEQHVTSVHLVKVVDSGYRDALGVDSFPANSFHNHGVTSDSLGTGLRPIALSKAGVVEALYHENLPILGFQWHPERSSPDPAMGSKLFLQWLELCQARSGGREPAGRSWRRD